MDENAQTAQGGGLSGSGGAAQAQDAGLEAFGEKAGAGGMPAGPDISHGQQEMAQAQNADGKDGAAPVTATQSGAAAPAPGGEGAEGARAASGFDARAWDAYVDGLDADLGVDKEALRAFGKIAGDLDMSADAAEKIFKWGMDNARAMREAQTARGRAELKEEWGPDYQRRIEQATSVVAMLDRQLGEGRFKKAIEDSGVCANPDFARGLYHIAALLAEDSLGAQGAGAAAFQEEDALGGLKNFFK